ncbi:PREDICTED: golgin-84-like isoform X2 [Vollenhovia emeryi]|nr:PREDICTED: golgin-84-like isoform X2 [Vollenhovia emeryi]XP_011872745.1 PREDICTED: golgin-84-like isoform X2 [Vollenhovia emeryi]
MSQVEKSDLTAGGDAPPVEAIKLDCADNTVAIIAVESANVKPEDATASAGEIAKEVLNVQTENERPIETTNNANVPGGVEEVVKPEDASTAECTNVITQIIHTSVEDVAQAEAQEIAQESNSSVIALHSEETLQSKSANKEKIDTSKQNTRSNNAACISRLEAELRKRTKECDSYRKKLEDTEAKLAALQTSYDTIMNHGSNEDTMQQSVEQLRGQLVQTALMYEERNRVVANQENQINALNNQVTSLKEVISITRDLLQIRNMEVKQLQAEVDNMEKKISEERDRHNAMISKMDTAMRLNADLKKEYETQLSLFQSLREKYGEKITLLSREKQALETAASAPE